MSERPWISLRFTPDEQVLGRQLADPKYRPEPSLEPTDAQPGSRAKVMQLAERAANGEHLWHPEDRTVRKQVSIVAEERAAWSDDLKNREREMSYVDD